jgi:TPR repeat protein
MYARALDCCDEKEKKHWLTMAAEEGHVPAMFDLGLLCDSRWKRDRWLEEAARNGSQAAMVQLLAGEC